jgi:putative PIN family toxin of toxin-antitoxin system
MRLVLDTNVVVSGLLWQGAPRQVMDAARDGRVSLFTSPVLLEELQDVLSRPKFAARLAAAGVTADELLLGYAALAALVHPAGIPPVIAADPDDDAVLACAASVRAEAISSGDPHLLQLGHFQGIPVLTPAQVLASVTQEKRA